MKIADLYIRVSTDEQADKGYSQRNQNEVLTRYCEINGITVRRRIYEDHSAKTFNRPQWQKLLTDLRNSKKDRPDLILFTKWDRFSRNAPDAYQMIATLKGFGIEPQAMEQPLDMSVPENKMMLAIYLTAPEIENDRRALNIFYGMRRAKKEGRWMATAPIGYANKTRENGTKYIAPKEPEASILKWAFTELAKGKYTVSQIYFQAKEAGLGCSLNRFFVAIRNPVYCGILIIPKFKEEEQYFVKATHEPIISESLFYEVQDRLDGKTKSIKAKVVAPDKLPLRGFIDCSRCTRTLCGSASKCRKAHYHYYHCSSKCGCRYKADEVNISFLKELTSYVINPDYAELFKEVIKDKYFDLAGDRGKDRNNYIKQITDEHNRITKARELLLIGDMDGVDFKAIKSESEQRILVLEAKLETLRNAAFIDYNAVKILLDDAIVTLTKINTILCKSDVSEQRKLIGSMFPEKFTFETLQHRTAKIGETYEDIYLTNRYLEGKKTG
ncbi:recombinase family protein [Pedobacter aquatilis]|uniref:recombinase family protein n=1 Tax=Pedobacter aquatilis TaxID=351343 RepID=UPI0025B45A8C|nr:recombinase family protein [Pedobacter aquatilis]MDN3586076.1 recombinase family protein [Pedobacter aquatilis]